MENDLIRWMCQLVANDGDSARLDDAALLERDLHLGRSEQPGVVDGDRCDDGDLPVGHVRRVPRPAEADFHDGDVDGGISERGIPNRDERLEVVHPRPPGRGICGVDDLKDVLPFVPVM